MGRNRARQVFSLLIASTISLTAKEKPRQNASRSPRLINIFGMIGFFWGYMFVAHMVKPRKQNVYYFSPCAEKKIVLWIVAAALLAFDALFLCPGFYF